MTEIPSLQEAIVCLYVLIHDVAHGEFRSFGRRPLSSSLLFTLRKSREWRDPSRPPLTGNATGFGLGERLLTGLARREEVGVSFQSSSETPARTVRYCDLLVDMALLTAVASLSELQLSFYTSKCLPARLRARLPVQHLSRSPPPKHRCLKRMKPTPKISRDHQLTIDGEHSII